MTNKEKAKALVDELGIIYTDCERATIKELLMEMAEWKDEQIKGFFFELALLLTTPKTNLEHSMRIAFPMSGFNEIDDILDFLHGKFLEYNNSGTILNDNNK